MSKINFKIKINYFDVFQNKKYFKKQRLPQFQTLFYCQLMSKFIWGCLLFLDKKYYLTC
jgi:hypothetical protein